MGEGNVMTILSCNIPKNEQRLYIRQLKKVIAHADICNCCPARRRLELGTSGGWLKKFSTPEGFLDTRICEFCRENVGLTVGCPCRRLGKDEAIKRAQDFIARFEAED